jgi:hypothetical protein
LRASAASVSPGTAAASSKETGKRAARRRRVGVHDPVAVDGEAHKGELFPTRRIADDFEQHGQPSR